MRAALSAYIFTCMQLPRNSYPFTCTRRATPSSLCYAPPLGLPFCMSLVCHNNFQHALLLTVRRLATWTPSINISGKAAPAATTEGSLQRCTPSRACNTCAFAEPSESGAPSAARCTRQLLACLRVRAHVRVCKRECVWVRLACLNVYICQTHWQECIQISLQVHTHVKIHECTQTYRQAFVHRYAHVCSACKSTASNNQHQGSLPVSITAPSIVSRCSCCICECMYECMCVCVCVCVCVYIYIYRYI